MRDYGSFLENIISQTGDIDAKDGRSDYMIGKHSTAILSGMKLAISHWLSVLKYPD